MVVLQRDRDLVGRRHEVWIRRALFALIPAISILALLNLFGQRPTDSQAASPAAALELHAPTRVRSGLLYSARFTIEARQRIANAVLVLDSGWFEATTVNTIEPSPQEETSADGRPSFQLGSIAAGTKHVLHMDFQVNPTNVGHRSQTVRLFDGARELLTLDRTITVFP
jgi:hypothetical protein